MHGLAVKVAEHLYGVKRVSKEVANAAQLHDTGKAGIRDVVLSKSGTLTDEEVSHIREHPVIGEGIVTSLPYLNSFPGSSGTTSFDGTGYPDQLAEDEIPLASRIISDFVLNGLIVGKDANPRVADVRNPAHEMNLTTLVGAMTCCTPRTTSGPFTQTTFSAAKQASRLSCNR